MTSDKMSNHQVWSRLAQDWIRDPFDYDGYLEHLLQIGLECLALDVAIISKIFANTYTIVYCVGEESLQDQEFELGYTYCSITTQQKRLVAINHMAISDHFRHPCYQTFKLESYIGVPIFLDGQLFGTLNFSSVLPRRKPFREVEQNFVRLMGETVNWALMAKYTPS